MTSTSSSTPRRSASTTMRAMRGSSGSAARARPVGGQLPVLVEGVQLLEEGEPVGDGAAVRRVDEREVLDVPEVEGGHLQQHRGEVGAQDLRIGELGPALEVGLGVEPDRDAGPEPPAPAGPLPGRRLADRLDRQPLHLGAMAVPGDPRRPRVDHVPDARHGQRGLGDVGGQHDAPSAVRREDLVLVGGRQPRVERDDLGERQRPLGQGVLGVADLPLAGEEHQDVARPLGDQLVDGVEDRGDLVAVGIGVLVVRVDHGAVAHLDRVGPAGDLDDRGAPEVGGHPLDVDRGRGDDELQVGTPRQQLGEVAQQEVDVEAPLVGLVEDDRVVLPQQPVVRDLGQQDAVGHQLDQRSSR